jgi:rare lipoprotein A
MGYGCQPGFLMRPVLRLSAPSNLRLANLRLHCGRATRVAAAGSLALVVAACGATGSDTSGRIDPQYGVAASPQLADKAAPIPRGGGVYKVGRPYKIAGNWYYPREDVNYDSIGIASWYGDDFHGRQTANGEVFDMDALSAAHPTLPMPTYARVTNLENGRSVVVRVNDRGPFAKGREIDLSRQAAKTLGMKHQGTAKVRVQYVSRARLEGSDDAWLRTTYIGGGATGNEPLTQLAQAATTQSGPVHRAQSQLAQGQLAQAPGPQSPISQNQAFAAAAPQVRAVQTQIIRPGAQQPVYQQPVLQQGAFVQGQPQTLMPAQGATPQQVMQPQYVQPQFTQPMPQPVPAAGVQAGYNAAGPQPSPVATQIAPAYTAGGGVGGLVPSAPISGFAEGFLAGQDRIESAFSAIAEHSKTTTPGRMLDPLTFDPAGVPNAQ